MYGIPQMRSAHRQIVLYSTQPEKCFPGKYLAIRDSCKELPVVLNSLLHKRVLTKQYTLVDHLHVVQSAYEVLHLTIKKKY